MKPVPQPCRILVVCHSYPPVMGGSEIEVQRVCKALREEGYLMEVACCGGHPMPRLGAWRDPFGTPVRIFGHVGSRRRRDALFAAGVVSLLLARPRRYDLAYFLMPGLHLAPGLLAARAAGIPALMKFSGSNEIRKMSTSQGGRLTLALLRRFARSVMILNEGMRQEALEAGLAPSRLVWMPNPVDTAAFRPLPEAQKLALRQRLGLPASEPVLLFVGRLAPEKELASLLRGFASATAPGLLLLVGDGPERSALQEQARALRIAARVRFVGKVDPAEVASWMQASDAFALVSSLEGFPCSLVEAMACGLPSVVSRIPANLQLISDGEHGFAVPVNEPAEIGAALTRLVRDGRARQAMGEAARRRVEQLYSVTRVTALYKDLFATIQHERHA